MYEYILLSSRSWGELFLSCICFMVDMYVMFVFMCIAYYEWKLSVHLHLLKITFDVAFKTESTCIM